MNEQAMQAALNGQAETIREILEYLRTNGTFEEQAAAHGRKVAAPKGRKARASKARAGTASPVPASEYRAAFGLKAQHGPGCETCGRQTRWLRKTGAWATSCQSRMTYGDAASVAVAARLGVAPVDIDGTLYVMLPACDGKAQRKARNAEVAAAHKAQATDVETALEAIVADTTFGGRAKLRVASQGKVGRALEAAGIGTVDRIYRVAPFKSQAQVAAFVKRVNAVVEPAGFATIHA